MYKRGSIVQIALILLGILFIVLGISVKGLVHTPSIIGIGTGLVAGSIFSFIKQIYWMSPKRKLVYEEKLQTKRIDSIDERKVMLRHMAGYQINQWVFILLFILNIFFTIIGIDLWIILIMYGVILFQLIGGIMVYKHLSKRM